MRPLFIAGTDTDAGKTWVTCALLKALNDRGQTVAAIKPLATGCDIENPEPQSDVARLASASQQALPYADMVYASHTTPCSPNLCLPNLRATAITEFCRKTVDNMPQYLTLIEGIGGWLCPINDHETMADAIMPLDCPTVLVVGLQLGCLNHTLLTVAHMTQHQAPLIGWIANCMDADMLMMEENIAYLERALPVPCLAKIPYGSHDQAVKALSPFAGVLTKPHSLPLDCSLA